MTGQGHMSEDQRFSYPFAYPFEVENACFGVFSVKIDRSQDRLKSSADKELAIFQGNCKNGEKTPRTI